ncbi:MAG: transposase [Elusimicrobiota bacterium]
MSFAKEKIIDGKRYIIYHNQKRAKQDEKERDELLFKITNSLNNLEEKLLDGKTVLHTDISDLTLEKVIETYKSLGHIESCFRDLKSVLKLRPIRHYTPERVIAHIFVCVIALLLGRMLEYICAKKKYPITAASALEALSDIKITTNTLKNEVREFQVKSITPIEGKAHKILGFLGLSKTQRVVVSEKT